MDPMVDKCLRSVKLEPVELEPVELESVELESVEQLKMISTQLTNEESIVLR